MSKRDRERREEYASATAAAEARSSGNFTSLNIPDGMKLFKPKKGKYTLDLLPYTVGEGNPHAKEGQKYFERTYWVHGFCIGPNNESHICLAKNFGKKCPACEHRESLMTEPDADKKTIQKLRPKQRQLFLVRDQEDSPDEVQLFDSSYSNFGEMLDEAINDPDHKGAMKDFYRPDADGKSLRCGFKEATAESFKFIECSSIAFKDRSKPLGKELLKDLPCLDELLKPLSYKEFVKLMEGGGTEKDDDDEDEDDEDTDTDDDDEDEDEKPVKKSKSKKSRDDDDDDDDNDDPPPKSSKKKKPKDDEDDDEEDNEDDEPPRKKKSSKKKPKDDDDDDDDDSDIPFDDDEDEDDDD